MRPACESCLSLLKAMYENERKACLKHCSVCYQRSLSEDEGRRDQAELSSGCRRLLLEGQKKIFRKEKPKCLKKTSWSLAENRESQKAEAFSKHLVENCLQKKKSQENWPGAESYLLNESEESCSKIAKI